MIEVDEVDASRIPYDELVGRYIFRKQMRFVNYDTTRLYKMDKNRKWYHLGGNTWNYCRDLFGELYGLTGDNYEFIVLTKEQAIVKAKEKWAEVNEGLFD